MQGSKENEGQLSIDDIRKRMTDSINIYKKMSDDKVEKEKSMKEEIQQLKYDKDKLT